MGISTLKTKVPPKPKANDTMIDLSAWAEGEKMRFRQPGISEMFPDTAKEEKVRNAYPLFSETTCRMCVMLASCYVSGGPGDNATPRDFAEIADGNPDLFLFLLAEFGNAFPVSLSAAVENAKND